VITTIHRNLNNANTNNGCLNPFKVRESVFVSGLFNGADYKE